MFIEIATGMLNTDHIVKVQYLRIVEQEIPSIDNPGEMRKMQTYEVMKRVRGVETNCDALQVFSTDNLQDFITDKQDMFNLLGFLRSH